MGLGWDENVSFTRNEAQIDWERARGRARRSILKLFAEPQAPLLPFEDVRTKLRLFQNYYKGVHNIPIDSIVGSVDRYQDFTREFLPLIEEDAERWQRVAALQRSRGLPPIEVYEIDDVYFVKDGNHRVSVMRQLGNDTIEAHVWEYPTDVDLSPEDDIDDILIKAERKAFLEKTRLDETRPDHGIVFTAPGRYPELEYQIELYRQNLSLIDGYEVSYEDAAASWYDMVYSLAAETIVESGLLDRFPGRTAADLYTWVYKHREEIAEREGRRISTQEAVTDLVEKDREERRDVVSRLMHQMVTGIEHLAQAGAKLVHDVLVGVEEGEEEFAAPIIVLAQQIRSVPPLLAYPHAGREEWHRWHDELKAKLAELLDVSPRDHKERQSPPEVTIHERKALEGVRRERITLRAADGLYLPGYLFVPSHLRTRGTAPAILIYPGHGTIQQIAGLAPSYHNGNALALARAGFVTLTLEQRGFGELGGVDYYRLDALARLVGKTWAGMTLADGMRGLDYLQSRPEVNPDRLGVVGMAMSGSLAMHMAALDTRVLATVVGDYLIRLDDITRRGPRYISQCVPNLRRYAEISDIGALIAPRPALYTCSEAALGQDKAVFTAIGLAYELLEVPDRLLYRETGPGRTFSNEVAAGWFKRWLVEEDDTHLPLLHYPYDLQS